MPIALPALRHPRAGGINYRVMFFFLIIGTMAFADAAWWWWADRRLRPLPHAWLWRSLLAVFMGGMLLFMAGFVLAPGLVRRSHQFLPMPASVAIYLWHLMVLPLTLLMMLLAAGGRLGTRVLKRKKEQAPKAEPVPVPEEMRALSRRQFFGAAAAALPPLVTAAGTVRSMYQIGDYRVRPITLAYPDLPPDLDGLTIAHLSDLHVGKFTKPGHLERIAEDTNKLKADLHLLTGDLIDLSIGDLPRALDFVKRLDPKQGLAMCEGNHDLIENARRFFTDTRAAGIPLLVDEALTLEMPGRTPVQFLGMRWGSPPGGGRGGGVKQVPVSMQRLLPQRRPDAFQILLAHHPHAFDAAAEAKIPLTLAGHTHGGMWMVTGEIGGGPLLYRYWSGPYRKGDSRLVVSNGAGCWYPLRINCPAEITHVTLRRST